MHEWKSRTDSRERTHCGSRVPAVDPLSRFQRQAGQQLHDMRGARLPGLLVDRFALQARHQARSKKRRPRKVQFQFQGDLDGAPLDAPVPDTALGVFHQW